MRFSGKQPRLFGNYPPDQENKVILYVIIFLVVSTLIYIAQFYLKG